jgi:hypothetical protein
MLEKLKEQVAANPENAMLWMILMVSFTVALLLMIKWQLIPNNGFDLRDIICSKGRLSSSKVSRFGAFMVSTWCFVYLVANDKLSEWYFMGYMAAWVGNALFSAYLREKSNDTSSRSKSNNTRPRRNQRESTEEID